MKRPKVFLYIAGALFFMMCGSLWQEYFGSRDSADPNIRNSVNPSFRHSVNPSFRGSKARYYAVPRAAVESFPFDPNEADSTQLLRLGLTPAQVRSIYRHRARGYTYSRAEDFARTPFMTKGQWNHLRPLIRIGDRYKPLNRDSMFNGQRSMFNGQCSTATVQRPMFNGQCSTVNVQRSVRSENQDSIFHSSFFIINLNESSFKDLVHHPFLSYEQVKAVKNFQRRYGRIRNMTELLILPEFTVEDTLRLSPYLQF